MKDKNPIIFKPGFFSDMLRSVCGLLSPILIGFLIFVIQWDLQERRVIFIFSACLWWAISGGFLAFRAQKGNKLEAHYAALGTFILGALHIIFAINPILSFLAKVLSVIGLVIVASLMLPMVIKRFKELKVKNRARGSGLHT